MFVACRVSNETSEPRAVTVRNCLDGPTLPPRRNGRPTAGWAGDRYRTTVDAGGAEPVGYACPTDDTSSPAVAVVAVGDPPTRHESDSTPNPSAERPITGGRE